MRTLLFFLLAATPLFAVDDWPQFRGPAGDGHADGAELPLTFSETENLKWRVPVHGKGWSSPVILGSQIWMTTATPDGTELSVLCLDRATGRTLRDTVLFHVAAPQAAHDFNSYASPTPVIEPGRIYVTYGAAGTACLDTASGAVLWQRTDLECNHFRGAGSSPIVWQDLLIMNFDGSDFDYVIALDKKTGKTVWKTNRSLDYKDTEPDGHRQGDGDYRKAFSTPQVAQVGGKPILFSSGAKAHYAYDPRTGKELWRYEEHLHHSAASRPIVGLGMVYFLTGYSKGPLLAVKLPPAGGPPVLGESDLAWRAQKAIPQKPSILLVNDLIFTVDDSGIAGCLEAKTGAEVWHERIPGKYSASPIYSEGRVYAFSEEGKVTVLAAQREFRILAQNQLEDGFMASPAAAGRALYLRTKTALYRVEQ